MYIEVEELYQCECGNRDRRRFVYDSELGEIICRECGLTQPALNITSYNPRVSPFKGRLGSIFIPSKDGKNSELLPITKETMTRLKKLNDRQNLYELRLYHDVNKICQKANAPRYVQDSILRFYLDNRKSLRHLRHTEMAIALLWYYSKQFDLNLKPIRELCKDLHVNRHLVRRYLSRLAFEHNLRTSNRTTQDYIRRYTPHVGLSQDVVERAIQISSQYTKKPGYSGNPRSIAAAAIWLAAQTSDKRLSQKKVGQICHRAEYTVRETAAKIRKTLGMDYA